MNYFEYNPSLAEQVRLASWASKVAREGAKKGADHLDRPESYCIISSEYSEKEILFYKTHTFKRKCPK